VRSRDQVEFGRSGWERRRKHPLDANSQIVAVTFRVRLHISMQRGGFGRVCGPRRDGSAVEIGMETDEKLAKLVEMRGYSVLRCKPCGQFLQAPVSRGMGCELVDEITPLERNAGK
jgi:hypothetical protein